MDALSVEWEYEPEGFDLGGKWYLPDFYLPESGMWLEIKPGDPEEWPDHPVWDYWGSLEKSEQEPPLLVGDKTFILLKGYPGYTKTATTQWRYWGYIFGDNMYWWCVCPVCSKVGIEYEGRGSRVCGMKCTRSDRDHTSDDPRILAAFDAVQRHRF